MGDGNNSKEFPMGEAVRGAYNRGEEDEALEPLVLEVNGARPGAIGDGEYVIFYDIRGEREIELTKSFTEKGFHEFKRIDNRTAKFVTMVEYDRNLKADVAFPPEEKIGDTLCEVICGKGLKVGKIVESEKAVHLSFFLNGKRNEPFPGEERIFIQSRKDITNYDACPEMSIDEVASEAEKRLGEKKFDLLIINFANIDVVGHIENEDAVKKAVEAVDHNIERVIRAARSAGYHCIITADHGTVEKWFYPEGTVDTGHTDSPVPFILVPPSDESLNDIKLREGCELTDIAPTILDIMGIETPPSMTGKSIIAGKSLNAGKNKNRVLLLIVDGWGHKDEKHGNLIAASNTPNMDNLISNYPFTTLKAAGEAVGMPDGTVGNSEVGHLHIGAGRRLYSDRLRIDKSIEDRAFFKNPAFLKAMKESKENKKPLHLLGIVSFYSSHGSIKHLFALMEMAKENGLNEVYIHSFLGRRGERPESGSIYIKQVEEKAKMLGVGKVVDVIGRFWSLDREENWDRIEKTYRALAYREGGIVKG
ncbi:MAG: alkaline phosphatase family protein [Candidatus Schekmanbacteria bacterium]|nr:alkaline phosphatase family protein [Candidatus Schekmanbacteria bacterium]